MRFVRCNNLVRWRKFVREVGKKSRRSNKSISASVEDIWIQYALVMNQ